jgi:hypothetical protein
MQKYIATPGAEVIGSAMQNLFVSVDHREFLPFVEQTLVKYGINTIENDRWYPHQLSLDIFKLINDHHGNSLHNLVALGMAYVETATFPPEINNISSALNALSLTYHLNIRNVPGTEGYEVLQLSDKHIRINDLNPFPHDTVYGFIWGIAKRFRSLRDNVPVIHRTFLNPEQPDDNGAVYDVIG